LDGVAEKSGALDAVELSSADPVAGVRDAKMAIRVFFVDFHGGSDISWNVAFFDVLDFSMQHSD
jgi:hypothetical protein